MLLRVIGSSSHGNGYILETDTGSLMIECGVKFSKIQQSLDFNLSRIQGCLISHQHFDHCRSVQEVMKAGIDVYMTTETATAIKAEGHRLNIIEVGKQFEVGDFIILPFPTEHDCLGAVGYLIYYRPTKEKLIFATDTYFIRNKFKNLNYILIECNYCKDTLDANIEAGYIDQAMKNRLLESHFSLEHVKEFLAANDLSHVQKIVLLHLSASNSDSERMIREITELTGKEVVVAEAGKDIPLEQYPF